MAETATVLSDEGAAAPSVPYHLRHVDAALRGAHLFPDDELVAVLRGPAPEPDGQSRVYWAATG